MTQQIMQKNKLARLDLSYIQKCFDTYHPELMPELDQAHESRPAKRAAVCIIISERRVQDLSIAAPKAREFSLLMIRRAKHLKDPWSGHMAFPGGRIEKTDPSIKAGALRELEEELAVSDAALNYIGRLSDIQANHVPGQRGLVISAYVFYTKELLIPQLNYEVAECYWLPFKFFAKVRRRKMWWLRNRKILQLPYYKFKKRRVWGLSLAMIDELFDVLNLPLDNKRWRRRYRHENN